VECEGIEPLVATLLNLTIGLQPTTGNTLHTKYKMIHKLNLPQPSSTLINLTRKHAYARSIDYDSVKWHKSIQSPEMNCAAGMFFAHPEVTIHARKEYQHFFKQTLHPIVGIIVNTRPETPACYPPHTDRVRNVGINFYIDAGGDNVTTVFYDKHDPIDDKVGGNVMPYLNLQPVNQYLFDTNNWYVIDTRQFHSVENILTSRCILSLSLIDCTVDELLVTEGRVELPLPGSRPGMLP
jgi:hypothetical protein